MRYFPGRGPNIYSCVFYLFGGWSSYRSGFGENVVREMTWIWWVLRELGGWTRACSKRRGGNWGRLCVLCRRIVLYTVFRPFFVVNRKWIPDIYCLLTRLFDYNRLYDYPLSSFIGTLSQINAKYCIRGQVASIIWLGLGRVFCRALLEVSWTLRNQS